MVIVTGPNQELAIKLIKRMKTLFELAGIFKFDSKGNSNRIKRWTLRPTLKSYLRFSFPD